MSKRVQEVEILPENFGNHQIPYSPIQKISWFRTHRLLVFSVVSGISLLLGLFLVFIRPPIYLSNATLLTVAPTALDEQSGEADIQHVFIQKKILTGQVLLEKALNQVDRQGKPLEVGLSEVRSMLTVTPIEDTNLVEVGAQGKEPEFLQLLINTLIEVYLQARTDFITETTGSIHDSLQEELQTFKDKIQVKRDELEQFRQQNDILSTDADDNQVRARLKGLNDSLNSAKEEEVKAKARLNAVKLAILNGEAVVPENEGQSLATLEEKAQELREQDAEIKSLYTPSYIKLRPDLNKVAKELAKIESKINTQLAKGKETVITEANLEYQSAKQAVYEISNQLEEHKRIAANFTTRFSEYEAYQQELLTLEESYRETQQRLTALEVKQREKYPQVDVVEWAFLPLEPVSPLYMRDAGIVAGLSLFLGLIAVWLCEFLTREDTQQSPITFSGIHMYQGNESSALEYRREDSVHLAQKPMNLLENNFPREYTTEEINILLNVADEKIKQLMLLLLNGLIIDEVAVLAAENLNLDLNLLTVTTGSSRQVPLSPALRSNIDNLGVFPAWQGDKIESSEDLRALITYTAIDSGIANAEEMTPEALRHTYILYLVRQGTRLSELKLIVGHISPSSIARYGSFSPEGAGIPISEISLAYPVDMEN